MARPYGFPVTKSLRQISQHPQPCWAGYHRSLWLGTCISDLLPGWLVAGQAQAARGKEPHIPHVQGTYPSGLSHHGSAALLAPSPHPHLLSSYALLQITCYKQLFPPLLPGPQGLEALPVAFLVFSLTPRCEKPLSLLAWWPLASGTRVVWHLAPSWCCPRLSFTWGTEGGPLAHRCLHAVAGHVAGEHVAVTLARAGGDGAALPQPRQHLIQ